DVRIIDENDDLLCISRCTVAIKEQRKQKSDRDEILKETILKALRFRNTTINNHTIKIIKSSYPSSSASR
ncbi:hypothetical protein N3930_43470, partial [Bacillus thuringiensis]|nr:hypothetical protein [Bacillus thuringiensis]